jgi:hypothetical protein
MQTGGGRPDRASPERCRFQKCKQPYNPSQAERYDFPSRLTSGALGVSGFRLLWLEILWFLAPLCSWLSLFLVILSALSVGCVDRRDESWFVLS